MSPATIRLIHSFSSIRSESVDTVLLFLLHQFLGDKEVAREGDTAADNDHGDDNQEHLILLSHGPCQENAGDRTDSEADHQETITERAVTIGLALGHVLIGSDASFDHGHFFLMFAGDGPVNRKDNKDKRQRDGAKDG